MYKSLNREREFLTCNFGTILYYCKCFTDKSRDKSFGSEEKLLRGSNQNDASSSNIVRGPTIETVDVANTQGSSNEHNKSL